MVKEAGQALDGKVALVTGAGRGVGRAYAHALAAHGAKVVINDLGGGVGGGAAEGSPADDVVAEIRAMGGQALANHDDVADYDAVGAMVASAVQQFGRLDAVIANAGIIRPEAVVDAGARDWADVLAVHANGTFNCIHHAASAMRGEGGAIITTGAITTDRHFPRLAAYRSAKAAIAVLTLYAAKELEPLSISVNSIMPGPTASRMSDVFFASLGGDTERFPAATANATEAPGIAAAAPETVPPLGVYLCTDEGRGISGRLFQMMGNDIGLVTPKDDMVFLKGGTKPWTTDQLRDRVPSFLDRASDAGAVRE